MLSVEEARARILGSIKRVETETVPLEVAAGRVLAEQVLAGSDLPAFDNSSVDGFAVRAAEVSSAEPEQATTLPVSGDVPAGAAPGLILQPGSAARIMTGAPLPIGADAVVMLEHTNFRPETTGSPPPQQVTFYRAAGYAENVRHRGDDLRAGQTVLQPGRRLGPADLGLLAMLGRPLVDVFRHPRLAILSTGDELIPVGAPPAPGKIRESNSYALAALAMEAGAEVIRLGIAPDQRSAVEQLIEKAVSQGADLILSSAGVSVGAFDFVREVVESHGTLDFWRVNMRPGKPLAFGTYREIPFVGLPGNPVSAYVSFLVFVAPAIAFMSGGEQPSRRTVRARVGETIHSDGRESYLRARVEEHDGTYLAQLSGHQGSGNLYALALANALLIIPSGVKSVPPGEEVIAWLL